MTRTALLLCMLIGLVACGDKASNALGTDVAAAQSKAVPEPAALPATASPEAKLVDAYLRLAVRLASDDAAGAKAAAAKVGEAAAGVTAPQAAQIKAAVSDLAAASDIAAQRVAFDRASVAVIAFIETAGNPLPGTVYVARCPMAFENRGARWLQDNASIHNPYYGASMLTCGSVDAQYAPGARKS